MKETMSTTEGDVISSLLANLPTVGRTADEISRSLFDMCVHGNQDGVRKLLHKGSVEIIDRINYGGCTPAFVACQEGHSNCLAVLLEHHADATKKADDGWGPVHVACQMGHYECVEVLLKHGIDANIAMSMTGCTPTYICCVNGHVKLLNLLIQHGGVDLDKADDRGVTPAHVASLTGRIKILSLLIHHHADINKRNNGGATPLYMARSQGHGDVVRLLLENGAEDNPNHIIPHFDSSAWKVKLTRIQQIYRAFID
jgi:ankyrin repeat protein